MLAPSSPFLRSFAHLSSAHGPSEVDRSYKPAICVPMNALPFGHRRAGGEVVVRPAREHNDLEAVGLLGKQCAEPVHPRIVALDELIVENDSRARVLCQRQPEACKSSRLRILQITGHHSLTVGVIPEYRAAPWVAQLH